MTEEDIERRCSLDLVLSLRITARGVHVCVHVVRTDEAVFIIKISSLSASVLTVSASDKVLEEMGCDLDATNVDICFLFMCMSECVCSFIRPSEVSTFSLLGGQSCALLWQAGYGYSKPTWNHEAQQGSVKLNFLLQLRLLTSTGVHVNPAQPGLSV